MKENDTYILQDWTIHPELNLLKNHQFELILKPRLMRLLDYFLQHPNKIITKDELLDYVWDGRMVTENLLTKSISELRKLLKEHFQKELQIETLRNVGYRLHINKNIPVSKPIESNIESNILTAQRKAASLPNKQTSLSSAIYFLLIGMALIGLLAFSLWSRPSHESYQLKHHKITSLKGLEMRPAVSPDGKNIAFSWKKDEESTAQIYVRALHATTPRQLSDNDFLEFNPIWSPDGQYVVFFRQLEKEHFKLIKKSVIGLEEIELARLDFFMADQLLWSKDEKSILFMARTEKTASRALYQLDLVSTKITQLTHPPKGIYGDIYPTYSQSKDEIAFIRADFGESVLSNAAPTKGQIMTLNLKTKEFKKIASIEQEINSFLYFPSMNSHLCWVTEKLGRYTILAFDRDGQQSVIGQTGIGMPRNASLSAEDKICYEYWQSSVDIQAYPLSTAPEQELSAQAYLNSTSWDWGLSFAADSKEAAFFSQRDGYTEIWLTDANQPENARQLTHLESPLLKSLALSPDGKQIVFNSIKNNQANLFLLSTNGQALHQLTNQPANYAAPEWSSDGQSIFYASTMSGDWQLYEHHLATDKVVQLTTRGGFRALPAPQNSDIFYFVKYHEDGLWKYHRPSKSITLVTDIGELKHSTNWAISDSGLYYLNWKKGISYVDYYDFESKENKSLLMVKDVLIALPSLALSPDFQTLYMAQGNGLNSDILEIAFLKK